MVDWERIANGYNKLIHTLAPRSVSFARSRVFFITFLFWICDCYKLQWYSRLSKWPKIYQRREWKWNKLPDMVFNGNGGQTNSFLVHLIGVNMRNNNGNTKWIKMQYNANVRHRCGHMLTKHKNKLVWGRTDRTELSGPFTMCLCRRVCARNIYYY